MQQYAAVAQPLHRAHVVADEQDGPPHRRRHVLHFADALLLELHVAHGQDFVDEQYLGLEVGRDREREPQGHPGRVALDRHVDELLDLGEGDNLVEPGLYLLLPHAQHRAVEVDVLAAGQVGVERGADLEQRAHAPRQLDAPTSRAGDAGQYLDERALARPVAADDADDLAARDLERHVIECPEHVVAVFAVVESRQLAQASEVPHGPSREVGQCAAQRVVGLLSYADPVPLRKSLDADRHVVHAGSTRHRRRYARCAGSRGRRSA